MDVSRYGNWLRIDAPAKLNLFLEVLARRPDGFHEIETLMVPITICDTLFVAEGENEQILVSCEWVSGLESRRRTGGNDRTGDLPTATDNLVFKAVDLLRRRAGREGGAKIHVVKRIPSAAGLGGASSDAASALVAANELWRLGWTRRQLAEVGSEIGSDVPFFLQDRVLGAAVCRGRGEQIESVGVIPPIHAVVIKPPVGLSTATVYQNCTAYRNSTATQNPTAAGKPVSVCDLRKALQRGDGYSASRAMFNRLQEPAERLCPSVKRLRDEFSRTDVFGHQMSGSGTSYFGICRNARHARQIASRLRNGANGEVFAVRSRS